MVLLNQKKESESWGASAKETVVLNFLCGLLLRTLDRKRYLRKTSKLPPGMVISKEKLSDKRCPTFVEINFREEEEYLFIEFGYEPVNVLGAVTTEFNCYSPCVIVASGRHLWLEPDPPKIMSYTGKEWAKDAPNFRAWIVEANNPGFKSGHLLAQVDGDEEVRQTIFMIESIMYVNIEKILLM